ncbi:SUKH-4 family immunity protein [Streptomyces sp. NPDC012508]|uniref:SUKH-4 family immunity protein n=1 Tax=Streptomyces sp. NPDC012508 TaxID=3364837 RepID=UPI0036B0B67D
MVTFAQAQERAEEWINGDVPAYQHREVRVREFGLGFVVWAEDREGGPISDGGRQRLVIARDSGEATLWPGLPVGEVIRRYEEEYGAVADEAGSGATAPAPPERVDLNATSFLLTPPEWLQDAADKLGLPPKGPNASQAGGSSSTPEATGDGSPSAEPVNVPAPRPAPSDAAPSDVVPSGSAPSGSVSSGSVSSGAVPSGAAADSVDASEGRSVDYEPTASDGVPAEAPSSSPWADANASSGGADGSVPLPATVFAPPLSGADDEDTPLPVVGADAPTALMSGGSALPPTAIARALDPNAPAPAGAGDPFASRGPASMGGQGGTGAPSAPGGGGSIGGPAAPSAPGAPGAPGMPGASVPAGGPAVAPPPGAPGTPGAPGATPPPGVPGAPTPPPAPRAPGAGDIADAATSKAALPPRATRGGGGNPPPPPQAPGAPGVPAGGYVPTQMVSQLGPDGPQPPGPPSPPTPPQPVHHAATMLAHPSQGGPGGPPPPPAPPGAPGGSDGAGVAHAATMLAHPGPGGIAPPGPPGAPGAPPGPPGAPGAPGGPGTPPGGVHHAATMLAQPGPGGPPAPPMPPPSVPGAPPAYGYPQQPTGQPTVGPGYQAVLRYRAPDGSEAQIIRRSAPGTPHPEWQILHELRAMNVPPQQVLELHTELESCELPGGYCARMIRETWPQARITNIAPYGKDHAGRQQGMRQLLTHQGELHQVADGPARPAPVRAPLPQVQPAPPIPPDGIAQEMAGAFGPGICRFDQRAVSRQGVPEVVALTLVWAGLPADFGPFFWAQPAQPVVPTLAELAAQRQIQPASDAGSYLVIGSDFGRALCVQYGTAHIVAVPVEAGPGGAPVAPQFVNSGLPEFARSMALLGRMWRLRFGLNPEQAGRWTVDFQAQLAMLDPAALASPENWWSVLLEQMWDGLL